MTLLDFISDHSLDDNGAGGAAGGVRKIDFRRGVSDSSTGYETEDLTGERYVEHEDIAVGMEDNTTVPTPLERKESGAVFTNDEVVSPPPPPPPAVPLPQPAMTWIAPPPEPSGDEIYVPILSM